MSSKVDRLALSRERRLHDRFRQRRMRMHTVAEFGGGRFEGAAEHNLRNQVGRMMTDDLASDHFAKLLARDDLDEALSLIDRHRLPVRAKRNLADLHLDPALTRLRLAEPNHRDLGLAVDTAGDRQQIEAGLSHARHNFHRRDSLRRRLMREQRRARDIADRIDTRTRRAKRIVYLDIPATVTFNT